MSNPTEREIVVGVDGSSSSKAALQWAVGQAALTGARVRAVVAWEFPAFYSWEGGPMPPEEFEQTARKGLNDVVDEVERETDQPVRIDREIMHGHSAQVLLDAARNAELLVVGSRGHGSFYGVLLGSVSQRCAQHAECPVVIVRT
ncbi:universal stress protein [Saccharopolyspora erythraea]|uniref:universal stress protein n=1 Tax=Saccharopolyspora erythraea TaxID=1836 RepID=UPI001BA62892|nr:universal stress protein [Saccharopolyspora erythraea]QUH02999.1 universal stress protein [Saccharopolyspora erythraea]